MPLMRDYEFPPFMRVSTDDHQRVLLGLDATVVGKKLLEAPKACLTKFHVLSREMLQEKYPVTRLMLSSISGRTHQLNVHCAAFGHPIVGDTVYGWNGDAAPHGGLDDETLLKTNPDRATSDLQRDIAQAVAESSSMNMCIHAKSIRFRHPVTKDPVSFSVAPPF
jgi:23S rRNA-/tRNA-specific pseudouridylate synthase